MGTIDQRALRSAFGAFATGVTVVTSRAGDGVPIGFTANSFASLSLDPPLLLVCLAKTSRNFANMTGAAGFAVNILAEHQRDVSNVFARPVEDRFSTVDWRDGPAGSPVFADVAAWFDCMSERVVDAGDHAILIGRVEAFGDSGRNGLGYVRGSYFTPSLEAEAIRASADEETRVAAVVERAGAILVVRTPDGRFALPSTVLGDRDPVEAIEADLQNATGLAVTAGHLFSVYSDRTGHRQNIVYRAGAPEGLPREGEFVPAEALPMDRLDTPQTADILRRFVTESALGNFGVYFGNETAGRVHAIAGRA